MNLLDFVSEKILSFKQNVILSEKLRDLGFEVLGSSLGGNKKSSGSLHCLTFGVEEEYK